jgi:GNAT superfamily N-acetyltransferase
VGSLDVDAILAAHDAQMRGAPTLGARTRLERDGELTRVVAPYRGLLVAPRDVGVRGRALDELIERQRAYFEAMGVPVEWKRRGHDLPIDLGDRLAAAGFVAGEEDTMLVALAEGLSTELAPPAGIEIRRVSSDADMRRIADLWAEVEGRDRSTLGDFLIDRVAGGPDDIVVLHALAGKELVSAGWSGYRDAAEFALLQGGVTLEAWRGRGIYRALVAARARHAAERGVRYVTVDASSKSAPILVRLGFEAVSTATSFIWTPG